MNKIPVMKPRFPDLGPVISRLETIRESGVYSNFGPQVKELESRYAKFLGTTDDKVVLVSNATVGITASIQALGGKTWLVPAWTFSATVAAALSAGVDCTFGDIDGETHWIRDPKEEGRFDGFLKVAPFGTGFSEANMDGKRNVVIDAAASIAAPMPKLDALPETNIVVFSLHATKVLGIGEGGVVVSGSAKIAEEIRRRTNFGFNTERQSDVLGTNAKISEFAAAIGHVVLDNWEVEQSEWLMARKLALSASSSAGLNTFNTDSEAINPYWIVMFDSEDERNKVEHALAKEGIQTRRWWASGTQTMPAYTRIPADPLVNTLDVSRRYLGLPFFRGINEEQLDTIIAAVRTVTQ